MRAWHKTKAIRIWLHGNLCVNVRLHKTSGKQEFKVSVLQKSNSEYFLCTFCYIIKVNLKDQMISSAFKWTYEISLRQRSNSTSRFRGGWVSNLWQLILKKINFIQKVWQGEGGLEIPTIAWRTIWTLKHLSKGWKSSLKQKKIYCRNWG